MLSRSHLAPFLHVERGTLRIAYLVGDARIVQFLDRLCRLVRRLEGWPRDRVLEMLRRQERRVRDATRLAGISKTLLDLCEFQAPPGADSAAAVRDAVFRARGAQWPPVPGDRLVPYQAAAALLHLPTDEVERRLYADAPGAYVLVRTPKIDGRALIARYNLELARAVLLDAQRVRLTARGGWRSTFRAIKLARLMYEVKRVGRSYEVELTGPAAAFVVRPSRYGARFARVIPALSRASGWRLDAEVCRGDAIVRFRVKGRPRAASGEARLGQASRRESYDSAWERSLAADFRERAGRERDGWRLSRESTPIVAGTELFFPDFTLQHADGREALIELVGFWTPEYLEAKARKVAAAGLDHLILVVYRDLAVGGAADALTASAGADRIVWFAKRPRAAEVLAMAVRHARHA